MKVSIKISLLAFFAISVFYGCKNNDLDDFGNPVNSQIAKTEITNWIDRHVAVSVSQTQSYDILKQNLVYEETHIQKRKNGEDVIIIPVKNGLKEKLKLDPNYSLKMITIKKNGKLRWSMIVAFLAGDGKSKSSLEDKSIEGIVNNERLEEDGLYKFFDLKEKLLYQVSYKNKKLTSYGSPRTREKNNIIKNNNGNGKLLSIGKNNKPNSILSDQVNCTDWYWVTTYYDQDGNVENETWDYLFTTCEEGGEGGGGGGGGSGSGGESNPEEVIDVELTQDFSFPVTYTNFKPDDYFLPDGNLSATPEVAPLYYDCKVGVTHGVITRKVSGVHAYPLRVDPGNIGYLHPEYGRIVRNVVPVNEFKDASFTLQTVSAYWSAEINFRWSYLDRNSDPNTDQISFYHSTSFVF